MLGFLRRRPAHGRGRLGAAVTAIPSAPVPVPTGGVAAAPPGRVPGAVADRPVAPAAAELPTGPLVELGFRDGTSACLDPGSAEARALDELARLLARGR